MRIIGFILVASLVLAVVKVAFALVFAALLLALLYGVLFRPKETLIWLGVTASCWLFTVHPLASLAALVTMFTIGAIVKQAK